MAIERKSNFTTNTVLVALLVVAAFLIGSLYTKVSYLEKGTSLNVAGAQAGGQPNTSPPPAVPTGGKVDIKLTDSDPSKGPKNAKVTVVEFADFQCPFCGAFSGLDDKTVKSMQAQDASWLPPVPNILKDYVDTGKVRFVWKDYPFLGQESKWALQAARCAQDQNKFWEYHDYLFSHQNGENQGNFSQDNLKKFASALGLNTGDFNNCMDNGKYTKAVDDAVSAGQSYGVNGTPATFVNGKLISGAASYSQFKSAIDAELK